MAKRKWLLQRTIKLLEKKQINAMKIIGTSEVMIRALKTELKREA